MGLRTGPTPRQQGRLSELDALQGVARQPLLACSCLMSKGALTLLYDCQKSTTGRVSVRCRRGLRYATRQMHTCTYKTLCSASMSTYVRQIAVFPYSCHTFLLFACVDLCTCESMSLNYRLQMILAVVIDIQQQPLLPTALIPSTMSSSSYAHRRAAA